MNGTETLTAILAVAGIVGTGWYFKLYLEARSRDKKVEFDAKATEQEIEKYRILGDLAKENARLANARVALDQSNDKLLQKLEDKDELVVGQDMSVTGKQGRDIVRKIPESPIEVRLDGMYRILSVQSGAVEVGFRATIENVESLEKLTIDIPEGTLDDEQLKSLQTGEWEKTALHMQINASLRGERLLKATLARAGLRTAAERDE
ncbi:hypothetical protein J7481_19480 [Labrenzia sp. R4_2]|uniref:hypothetical protein n=1 Tax=Labrenzia sp. R4_2 TaxID=2821107 RepID=UPI001ADBFE4D|nr:hypothetical protein [Labrenzia sp. R4_2]MBO9421698.1 hypothetical protein [Labrenzia sp. R4_2]